MTETNLKKQKPIGGAFIIARKIFESDIFKDRPAFYFKLWIWMIGTARWVGGEKLDRGWLITTYKEMANIASHKVGYCQRKPTKAQIDWFMRFLRKSGRIGTIHTTRGLKIFIKNYAYYQDLSRYEKTDEHDNEHDNDTTVISHDRKERVRKRKKDISKDKAKPLSSKEKDPEFSSSLKTVIHALEDRLNTKIVNWGKQARALKAMNGAGYTEKQILAAIEEMAQNPFFKDKGFDLTTVSNQIPLIKAGFREGVEHGR